VWGRLVVVLSQAMFAQLVRHDCVQGVQRQTRYRPAFSRVRQHDRR
jgi:hypothetical protein